MKIQLINYVLTLLILSSCSSEFNDRCSKHEKSSQTTQEMKAKNNDQEISCKLTAPELQKRKETVIASLKRQVIERKELSDGYTYKFPGSDAIVDELAEFVKSERSCCSFFIFGLSFSGDGSEAWLTLTGPESAKQMIVDEIGLWEQPYEQRI
jgi:hypothetical protein